MKATKIIFWITTTIIFLFEGVMPALTGHTELAVEGIRHLQYPDYFRVMLNVFKVAGALTLILPFMPARLKEWAYAGLTFTFIAAAISHGVIDGMDFQTFMPLIVMLILAASYFSFHKLQAAKKIA